MKTALDTARKQTQQHYNRPCGQHGLAAGVKVIGTSDQVHMVDALAISGDEGRCSLR